MSPNFINIGTFECISVAIYVCFKLIYQLEGNLTNKTLFVPFLKLAIPQLQCIHNILMGSELQKVCCHLSTSLTTPCEVGTKGTENTSLYEIVLNSRIDSR